MGSRVGLSDPQLNSDIAPRNRRAPRVLRPLLRSSDGAVSGAAKRGQCGQRSSDDVVSVAPTARLVGRVAAHVALTTFIFSTFFSYTLFL